MLCATTARRALTASHEPRKPAASQPQPAAEHFAKDGLSFDYPSGWKLVDKSTDAAQHLILAREGSSVLIMVIAHRDAVANLQQFEQVRDAVTTPYVADLARGLGVKKAPAWDDAKCIDVAGRSASGFRLAGRSNNQPSTGEVYALTLGRRFVNLVYVRNDKDDAEGAAAWRLVLDTLKVEGPQEASVAPSIVSGGVLNSKAIKKPAPEYPGGAKAAGQQGTVVVQLTVDEGGNVAEAKAVSGPPLLKAAAEKAALGATFKPVKLCGRPVKVSGVVTYNFVLQFGLTTVRP
jgi:TonB family protein